MGVRKNQDGMGFRDLVSFNSAMLAKQLQRIITKPHSLVVVDLKEKYFKHGNVLSTQLKRNVSFMWKCIMAAKELIIQDSRWQIGNGEKNQDLGR